MIDTMIIQGSTPPPVVVDGDPEGGWVGTGKGGFARIWACSEG